MTSQTRISRRVIGDLIQQRLESARITVYRSEVPTRPPVQRTSVSEISDTAGRVAPYVALYVGMGAPVVNGESSLEGGDIALSATHQLTCVAGLVTWCEDLTDMVHDLMYLWTPVIPDRADLSFGRMRPPPGYDAGNPRRDDELVPPRWWVPLQYRLDAGV